MENLKMILQRAGTFLAAIFLALTTLSVGNNLIIKKVYNRAKTVKKEFNKIWKKSSQPGKKY